jgi:hypothetical protein
MNIYTYYDEVLENQIEIIEIWKDSWRKNGWNPIVLDIQSINCSDVQIEYLQNLPSVNPKKYEMACFLRWNAMSNIGGGWMCDYDVINLGFSPEDSKNYKSMSILQGHVPCLVYGSSEDYMNIFDIFTTESMSFLTIEYNRPHTSDMIVISNISNRESINCLNIVDYFYSKKEESILIHCSAGCCKSMSVSKKEAMISIL